MAIATDPIAPAVSTLMPLDMNAGGTMIGVVSAAGGAGATSLAVATACLGAQRTSTALVDLDPLGLGVERVIGYPGDVVTHWGTLGSHALHPRRFAEALPHHRDVRMVGFAQGAPISPDAGAVDSVLSACVRSFGVTVLDLPRTSGVLSQAARCCDLIVVCCPQSLSAVLAGQRLTAAIRSAADVVVTTRTGPGNVSARDVAESLRVPLLVEVGDQRGLDEVLAMGADPLRSRGSGLCKTATAILDRALIS